MAITYHVANARTLLPGNAAAARNPDRLFTVNGDFFSDNGKGKPGEALTITNKVVTRDMAVSPDFDWNPDTGILTIPSKQKGRKASAGATADQVRDLLASVRASK